MSLDLYNWYKTLRKQLLQYEKSDKQDVEMKKMIDEWKTSIALMESAEPDLKQHYDKNLAIQESFTREQVDFICYQIGDWYLYWKERIICDYSDKTHRLGYAKEQLKTLICGD